MAIELDHLILPVNDRARSNGMGSAYLVEPPFASGTTNPTKASGRSR